MRRPRIKGSLARARYWHAQLERIAERDFGGGFLIEPAGWLAAWSMAFRELPRGATLVTAFTDDLRSSPALAPPGSRGRAGTGHNTP